MAASFGKILSSEWLKLPKSTVLPLVAMSPLFALLIGLLDQFDITIEPWFMLLGTMSIAHAMLFLPILTGVFGALVCRYEHSGGGWKQILSLPLSRTKLYMAKFTIICLLIAMTQLLFLGAVLSGAVIKGIEAPIPWETLMRSVFGGWVACLPLAALQLGLSTWWSSFAAPLAINVMLTLPSMLVVNSATYGPYYPWSQPLIAMLSIEKSFGALNMPFMSLLTVIIGGFTLFFFSGLIYFQRKEM